jgi:hypothetical protein
MVPIAALWVPIVLSAIIVFVVSSIIHMMLPYHRTDFDRIPDEGRVMEALRKFNLPPGDYVMPCAVGPKETGTPEFIEKMKQGPVMVFTVIKNGPSSMAANLVLWFLYCVVVGIFAAYIAGRALGPGAHYLAVFRFAGCTAFIGHSLALWQGTIWFKRSWKTALKSTIDGLIYGLLTGGTFGWLWPA